MKRIFYRQRNNFINRFSISCTYLNPFAEFGIRKSFKNIIKTLLVYVFKIKIAGKLV